MDYLTLGWIAIGIGVVTALVPIVLRPNRRDAILFATAGFSIGVWNLGEMMYRTGPNSTHFSGFYIACVALAVSTWFVLGKRLLTRTWWPSPQAQVGLLALPTLVAASSLLPSNVWEAMFWTTEPWRDETQGWAYIIHCAWVFLLIALGSASMIRRAESVEGLDRYLPLAAVTIVAIGAGGQLTQIRIMPITALIAFMVLVVAYLRMNPNTVTALAELSERDPVTGAMTRQGLDGVLAHAVTAARLNQTPLSLMVIDLDNFKSVNDIHGHMTGDIALRHIAGCARRVVSDSIGDIVGRFGGDEFVVVLPGVGLIEANDYARRIVAAAAQPYDAAGLQLVQGISIGVAEYAGTEIDDLLVAADRAMYAAKRRGGGFASLPRAIS